MTKDTIAWLLRIQENGEDEETPELPEIRDVGPVAGREPEPRPETASDGAARPAEADTASADVPGRRTEDGREHAAQGGAFTEELPAGETFTGTEERDALLTRRLYRSLVRAERSVKLAFSPAAGAAGRPAAVSTGQEESTPTAWMNAGPAVSFHLNGLDARTMDEWFGRDARRYDATDLG